MGRGVSVSRRLATMASEPMQAEGAAAPCLRMLLQTPPGQLQNVLQDLKGIMASSVSDSDLSAQLQPWLEQHSHEQLPTVSLAYGEQKGDAIVCKAAKVGDKYIDPNLSCLFTYDHAQESVRDVHPCERVKGPVEEVRSSIDQALAKYVYNHYHTGISAAYTPTAYVDMALAAVDTSQQTEASSTTDAPTDASGSSTTEAPGTDDSNMEKDVEASSHSDDPPPTEAATSASSQASDKIPDVNSSVFTLHIVGNKYNLRNFWAGRWRSTYSFDVATRSFTQADIQIQSHYFENGNVQMHAKQLALPPRIDTDDLTQLPAALVAAIEAHEQAYQGMLFNTIEMLREKAFKALRRTLPITRQKIDWDKAVSYKLGAELANK